MKNGFAEENDVTGAHRSNKHSVTVNPHATPTITGRNIRDHGRNCAISKVHWQRVRGQKGSSRAGAKLLRREMKSCSGLTMAVKQTNCKMMKAATV